MDDDGRPIAVVTGAGGLLGLELTTQLLAAGYHVRGSVRSLKDPNKCGPLLKLGAALPGTLRLYEADLSDPGAFDGMVSGARYVFHVASPVTMRAVDPQREIVDLAVAGAENVLRAVARAPARPRRVVLTSSVAAVSGFLAPGTPSNGSRFTEADWNGSSMLETEPYPLSKTLAECAAWAIAESNGLDLVTVCPSVILGPLVSCTSLAAVRWFASMVEGGPAIGPLPIIDVRDCARAHIAAAENPDAAGRYIVSSEARFDFNRLLAWMREEYPHLAFAQPKTPEPLSPVWDVSKARADLGLSCATPARKTMLDAVRTMFALGLIDPKTNLPPATGPGLAGA